MFHALRVNDLKYMVRLGCTVEERAVPQEVRLTLEFRFTQPPCGVSSDRLDDTICYAEVSALLAKHFAAREFQLIEKIAYDAYLLGRELAGTRATVAVAALKVKPPVANLLGGAAYSCGDFQL